jgi:EpsD family peptidyl-prolyl cis-trans isomerase
MVAGLCLSLSIVVPLLLLAERTAYAASSAEGDLIVDVDGAQITKRDLENAVSDRIRKSYDLGDDQAIRLMVLKQLILETVAERLMTEKEISGRALLVRNLASARRDLLLKSYIDNQTVLKRPNEEDIKKYIAEHPEYFSGRKMYHYSELFVDAKTEVQKKAVSERLNRLVEFKEPTADNMQMVIAWLEQNNIPYGYVKDWKATEALQPNIRKIIAALSQSSDKVNLESNAKAFRVISLYGAYPDPIDPLFAKNAVARALLDEARNKRVDAIVDDMLSHTNITLYDKSYSNLKVPKFKGAVIQPRKPLIERIYLAWNFALLVLTPVSLYIFFTAKRPEPDEYTTTSFLDDLSYHILFRLSIVLIAGTVLIAPTLYHLRMEYFATTVESYASLAALGLVSGLLTLFVLHRFPVTEKAFSSRWVGVSLLVVLQIATSLMLE